MSHSNKSIIEGKIKWENNPQYSGQWDGLN